MIKFITKLFTDPEKLDESSISMVSEIPEIEAEKTTKTELFNASVNEVLKQKLMGVVEHQLDCMCYSEDEVNQTRQAQQYLQGTPEYSKWAAQYDYDASKIILEARRLYPLAVVNRVYPSHNDYFKLSFNTYLLASKIIKDELGI